jgi:hypothetical protein
VCVAGDSTENARSLAHPAHSPELLVNERASMSFSSGVADRAGCAAYAHRMYPTGRGVVHVHAPPCGTWHTNIACTSQGGVRCETLQASIYTMYLDAPIYTIYLDAPIYIRGVQCVCTAYLTGRGVVHVHAPPCGTWHTNIACTSQGGGCALSMHRCSRSPRPGTG